MHTPVVHPGMHNKFVRGLFFSVIEAWSCNAFPWIVSLSLFCHIATSLSQKKNSCPIICHDL